MIALLLLLLRLLALFLFFLSVLVATRLPVLVPLSLFFRRPYLVASLLLLLSAVFACPPTVLSSLSLHALRSKGAQQTAGGFKKRRRGERHANRKETALVGRDEEEKERERQKKRREAAEKMTSTCP